MNIDSFSPPSFHYNLANREYFQSAKKLGDGELLIGKKNVGKISGIPFLPISTPVTSNGAVKGVLTAMLAPQFLIPEAHQSFCIYCVSMVTNLAGEPLAAYPSVQLPQAIIDKFEFAEKPSRGITTIESKNHGVRIYWIRNEYYPVVSVVLEFIETR